MFFPIIPDIVIKISNILNIKIKDINFNNFENLPKENKKINSAYPIFPRFENQLDD